MIYTYKYKSPLGHILLAADEVGITGLWFEGQKYFADLPDLNVNGKDHENDILKDAIRWLNIYFSGKNPDFMPALHPIGSDFQKEVWEILLKIPYGKTMTYGNIAKEIALLKGCKTMSAQAIGGAVGHNKISIIIPCHRVVGTDGNLTGYAGGIDKKVKLLKLEQTDMTQLYIPNKGTAL